MSSMNKVFTSLRSTASKRAFSTNAARSQVESYYGTNVFDKRTMQKYLSGNEFQRFIGALNNHTAVDTQTADAISNALLKWSKERGVTHFTHWFQPLSGTAEKHDTFLDLQRDGETPLTRFTYKQLTQAEPDGSSFPSGGLRATHTARGYTAWDPNSPPFVISHDNGATLYIPSCFFSWENGKALDERIPLLRSEVALRRETLRLFNILGEQQHTSIHTDSGLEQEFFLVDRDYYLKRPDLMATGRTLFGALPPKNQQMEDQYFGHISTKVLNAMEDFEMEAWKLGIPIQTRHREVAPGQYEFAPRFAPVVVGTDRNLLVMELTKKIMNKHGLAALFHEKPFRGVNGSGKHNNWSLGSNISPSLLNPGNDAASNTNFLFFLAATIRAVDMHGDLMRVAISGAGNDHRLGANEAPPAIVSAYLGDDIYAAVERFCSGAKASSALDLNVNLGIPTLHPFTRASTDRNRTSTFAFTGNKFEFRAVGSSQNPARSNQVLNTVVADSIRYMADECEKLMRKGYDSTRAKEEVSRSILSNHRRVIFDGNGYSEEWQHEAARRGLPNLRTTPDALKTYNTPKNQQLYTSLMVLTPEELEARSNIYYEDYIKRITIEAKLTAQLATTAVAPVAFDYQQQVASSIAAAEAYLKDATSAQRQTLSEVAKNLNSTLANASRLTQLADEAHHKDSLHAQAKFCEQDVISTMNAVRDSVDKLESLVPSKNWPMPNYHEMLFHQE